MTILGGVPAAHADPITIEDPNLLACINAALDEDRAANEAVTEAEAAGITELSCSWSDIEKLDGIDALTNLGSLTLNNNWISDVAPLGSLSTLEVLVLQGNRISDVEPLAGLVNLRTLRIDGNQVTDIDPLHTLTNLRILGVAGNELSDLSVVPHLTSLTRLFASRNNVRDVEPLRGTGIYWVYLDNNEISDIEPLATLPNVTWLRLEGNAIDDVSPLAGLTTLGRGLSLDNNRIADLSPLEDLGPFDVFTAQGQNVDLGVIAAEHPHDNPVLGPNGAAVPLMEFSAGGAHTFTPPAGASNVSWDDGAFTGTLHFDAAPAIGIPDQNLLACINDELGNAPDAPVLVSDAETITRLDCEGAGIESIEGIDQLAGLTALNLFVNEIPDISPLGNLPQIEVLDLGANRIVDLAPLSDLANLQVLFLDSNDISEISALAGLATLQELLLDDNSITDVSPLAGLTELEWLDLSFNSITDLSPLANVINDDIEFHALNQTVDLGEVPVGEPQDNPVIGADGTAVPLADMYDAAANTFTATTEGDHQTTWGELLDVTDPGADLVPFAEPGAEPAQVASTFSGTLHFTAVAAQEDAVEDDATEQDPAEAGQPADPPADGDPAADPPADGDPGAGEQSGTELPATGASAALLTTGLACLLVLIGLGLALRRGSVDA